MLNSSESSSVEALRYVTRRHFFQDCRLGLGTLAFASMLGEGHGRLGANESLSSPMDPSAPPFPATAKRVIYLFMAGGPSSLELFDEKPKLRELNGKPVPESLIKTRRFAFLRKNMNLLGTRRQFRRHGESGLPFSELLPHIASHSDDICMVQSVRTDVFNHGPAKLFMNTGSPQFSGRPSMGSWVTYGIGSESRDLPGFVVLQSGGRGPRGGAALWGSGFLPTTYQGVPFLSGPEPILNLTSPSGFNFKRQRQFFDAVRDLNILRRSAVADPEISTRIAAYEMAYRMQTSAPELMELRGESTKTLEAYGAKPGEVSYANNCLLARRLVERGVRFVQLYHADWDHHGGGKNLGNDLEEVTGQIDRPTAALIGDLKQRGMLDDTLVIWGGEFGRTPMGEPRDPPGRDHHKDAFTMLFAGGGVRGGTLVGKTDDLGFEVAQDPAHVHDIQATMLHLLGFDHEKLTFRFQGRDFRLTDVHGHVVEKMLAAGTPRPPSLARAKA